MPAPTTDPLELRLRWLDDAGWALFDDAGGVPFYLGRLFGRSATVTALMIEVRMLMSMRDIDEKYTLEIEQ